MEEGKDHWFLRYQDQGLSSHHQDEVQEVRTVNFFSVKDQAYIYLRTPYNQMYKAADIRDYERMRLDVRLARPPFAREILRQARDQESVKVTTLGDLLRMHYPPYEEATDPEDVAVLGYN